MRRPLTPTSGDRPPLQLVGAAGTREENGDADHPARWARPHLRSIVITSGKGGVGKSHLAANLAVALGARGARVLLVDGDLSQANLDLLLGVHPRFDLQHVLSGEKSIEEILVPVGGNVTLVPATSGVPELADLDDYRREVLWRALGQLEADYDLMLIDTVSGVTRQATSFCLAADDVVVLTTPEMPAFSDAYGLIKLLQAQGLRNAPHLIVSLAESPEEAEETAHRIRLVARRFLRLEIDSWGVLPYDPALPLALRRQEPVLTAFPQSPSAAAYRALAARLWDVTPREPHRSMPPTPERLQA